MVTRGGPQPRTVEGGAEALNRLVNGHCMGEVARSSIALMDSIGILFMVSC